MTEAIPEIPTADDTDVFLTRVFAAPRDVVWAFFTDPQHLPKWFGPAGVHVDPDDIQIDLRVGGTWNLVMVDDATGARYPIRTRITAVTPPEYLEGAADAEAADGPIRGVTLRMWFHDHGDRTRLTLHQGPFTDEQRHQTADGWESSFDRMDAALENPETR